METFVAYMFIIPLIVFLWVMVGAFVIHIFKGKW